MSEKEAYDFAEKILEFLVAQPCPSFAELATAWPEHFRDGDREWLAWPDSNIVIWTGLSELAMAALDLLRDFIEPTPCPVAVYLTDGMALNLPIATQAKHSKPHWLPVTFNFRRDEKFVSPYTLAKRAREGTARE